MCIRDRYMTASSESLFDFRVHLEIVVTDHSLVSLFNLSANPSLEGWSNLGVNDVDHILQNRIE